MLAGQYGRQCGATASRSRDRRFAALAQGGSHTPAGLRTIAQSWCHRRPEPAAKGVPVVFNRALSDACAKLRDRLAQLINEAGTAGSDVSREAGSTRARAAAEIFEAEDAGIVKASDHAGRHEGTVRHAAGLSDGSKVTTRLAEESTQRVRRTLLSDMYPGEEPDFLGAAADKTVDLSRILKRLHGYDNPLRSDSTAGWRTDSQLLLRGDRRASAEVFQAGFVPWKESLTLFPETTSTTRGLKWAADHGVNREDSVQRLYVVDAPGGYDVGSHWASHLVFPGGIDRRHIVGMWEIPWQEGRELTYADLATEFRDHWRPNPHHT